MIVVRNRVLTADVLTISRDVQLAINNGKLGVIRPSGQDDLQVTCPFHAGGMENRPSCFIRLEDGVFHCFTCSTSGPLQKFVAGAMDISDKKAEDWLIANYGGDYTERQIDFPTLFEEKKEDKVMDESILDTFESYHPYMTQRKLTDEVINKFQIKYDPKTGCIVFPVRDSRGVLRFLTRRSVSSKKFIIDKEANKKYIYLLNEVYKNDSKEVYVVESQINALTLQGWGYNAVALFGAGTPLDQIIELNKTGVNHFILALDNDPAGIKGTVKLCSKLFKNKLVDVVLFTDNRDVNDLTKEEFDSLERVDRYDYLQRLNFSSLQENEDVVK